MFNKTDQELFTQKGITTDLVNSQIDDLTKGFPFMQLIKPATIGDGIIKANRQEEEQLIKFYESAVENNLSILKFVPASGAATRMFKALYEFLNLNNANSDKNIESFLNNINKFAFSEELQKHIDLESNTSTISTDIAKKIVTAVLDENGLKYGQYPKGVLKFHNYDNQQRTPIEEHMVEGAKYCKNKGHIVNIHFTISPEHESLFKEIINSSKAYYETKYQVRFNINFSFQKASTDTIAVTPENTPFRKEDGTLLFRPGGHGALIENLNELQEDIIFIKNIDNVVSEHLLDDTIQNKKIIAGKLLQLRETVFNYLSELDKDSISSEYLDEIKQYAETNLSIIVPQNIKTKSPLKDYLALMLNRPIRVCGMVKNEGEPGGGPFWTRDTKGNSSLQIVESSQVDSNKSEQNSILKMSSHFNPVDLVIGTKNYKGEKFDLKQFIDKQAGFISNKSLNGKELKALELPGLWNGAMSNWITVFMEVPVSTFNPVKTVNDLLRPAHQPPA